MWTFTERSEHYMYQHISSNNTNCSNMKLKPVILKTNVEQPVYNDLFVNLKQSNVLKFQTLVIKLPTRWEVFKRLRLLVLTFKMRNWTYGENFFSEITPHELYIFRHVLITC